MIKRSDSRAAPGGRVSNTAGGNAAANAPNERQSARLLRIGLKPNEQAHRALLRRTTISIAQPFDGPKDVTVSVRERQSQSWIRAAGSLLLLAQTNSAVPYVAERSAAPR